MAQDIMADSQTESVLSLLDRGEADDKTRDRVSAALLRSQTKLVEAVEEMKTKLWSFEELDRHIDERHEQKCANCPAKKYAESQLRPIVQKSSKPWYVELIMSDSIRYFIIILILAWAVIVMKTSTDEAAAVMENVQKTLTGGIRK